MVNNDTMIEVVNRFNGSVGYSIPDDRLERHFEPKETKMISMDELRKLTYQPGGTMLIKQYLVVKNEEAVKELLGDVEPEYFYSAEQIKNLLLNGSLDQLLDTLDFAPDGVIDMIKDYAVALEINDVSKRQAILNVTGFDVNAAIRNLQLERLASADEEIQKKKERRVAVAAPSQTKTEGRRTAAPTVSTTSAKAPTYRLKD